MPKPKVSSSSAKGIGGTNGLQRSASTNGQAAGAPEKMGRRQRQEMMIPDMVNALRFGTYDEKVEAAVVLGALATLSDGHRMRIMSCGALDALLNSTDIFSDFVLPRYALRTLADLSVNESVRQEVKNRGGLPQLIDVARKLVVSVEQMPQMLQNSEVSLVAQAVTAVLSAQSNNDSSKVIIREMQGIDLLVSALKLFSSSEEVQEQVCTALANLSLDPAARLKILSIKGVETICAVLQSKPPCKVVLSSLRALAHVSRIDKAAENFQSEAVEAVVRCMTNDPEEETNMWAAQVLSNLAAHKDMKSIIEKGGGTKALSVLLVESQGMPKRVTSWVVLGLSRLVSSAAAKQTIHKEKAAKPAVWLLGNLMSNMSNETIPQLLTLISALCAIEACQVEVHDAHGTQIVTSIVCSGLPVLTKSALYALSTLADYPPVRLTICEDYNTLMVLFNYMQNNKEVSALAAAIIAKCTKSVEVARRLATEEVMATIFQNTINALDEKTSAWAANCVTNCCSKLGEELLEKCPGTLVNIMSILVKDTSNDVRVWLEGALAELSQIDDCAAAIVDMSGITLMAQFISASTDGQCIEMAASVLKNLASKGDPRGEFNSQGAIRPLVNLLRVSQENNDLENTRNIVTCMEHISESPDNGRALRQSGAIPLLVYLLGNQVGAAFVDLESEAAATLAHLAEQDPGSLDIIRQAGAVPKLLAMLSIANHGINGYYIPTAVTKAVQCLTAISRDNEANRRAVLNSSNFYAVEALRMRELELESEVVRETVEPLLEALRLNSDWLKDAPKQLVRRRSTKSFNPRPERDSPDSAPVGNNSRLSDDGALSNGAGPPLGVQDAAVRQKPARPTKEVSFDRGMPANRTFISERGKEAEAEGSKRIVFASSIPSAGSLMPPSMGPIAALLSKELPAQSNGNHINGSFRPGASTQVQSFPLEDDDDRSSGLCASKPPSETSQASLDYYLAQELADALSQGPVGEY